MALKFSGLYRLAADACACIYTGTDTCHGRMPPTVPARTLLCGGTDVLAFFLRHGRQTGEAAQHGHGAQGSGNLGGALGGMFPVGKCATWPVARERSTWATRWTVWADVREWPGKMGSGVPRVDMGRWAARTAIAALSSTPPSTRRCMCFYRIDETPSWLTTWRVHVSEGSARPHQPSSCIGCGLNSAAPA